MSCEDGVLISYWSAWCPGSKPWAGCCLSSGLFSAFDNTRIKAMSGEVAAQWYRCHWCGIREGLWEKVSLCLPLALLIGRKTVRYHIELLRHSYRSQHKEIIFHWVLRGRDRRRVSRSSAPAEIKKLRSKSSPGLLRHWKTHFWHYLIRNTTFQTIENSTST